MMTVRCILKYFFQLNEGKALFIIIQFPLLNKAGIIQSGKIRAIRDFDANKNLQDLRKILLKPFLCVNCF